MASVNDADRGITSSHNFWLPMADACCQTVEEPLSFVTYSEAATDLDPDQLVLGPKNSHRSLTVTLCLPGIICQLAQETSLRAFISSSDHCDVILMKSLFFKYYADFYMFCFRNPSPTLRNPEQWCRSFSHFIGQ